MEFRNFDVKVTQITNLGQKWANMAQNTRYSCFPVEISVMSEISHYGILLFRESGYFVIYRIFTRPLDKIVPDVPRPFNFLSLWYCEFRIDPHILGTST